METEWRVEKILGDELEDTLNECNWHLWNIFQENSYNGDVSYRVIWKKAQV